MVDHHSSGRDALIAATSVEHDILVRDRMSALGWRGGSSKPAELTVLTAGDLQLDLIRQRCTRRGELIELNCKEFALFEIFMRIQGRVMIRNMLLEKPGQCIFDPASSAVETHMNRLRSKVEKSFGDKVIRAMRGAGYVLD